MNSWPSRWLEPGSRGRRLGAAALVLVLGALSGAARSEDKAPEPQPIPFSHKVHAAAGLKCAFCHPIEEPGFSAGLPAESKCMVCHTAVKSDSPDILKLAKAAKAGETIPWVRIYRVPDYVWFSHALHAVDAEIECAACHGPVATREVLVQEKPTSMEFCMDCHAAQKASNGCEVCHLRQ